METYSHIRKHYRLKVVDSCSQMSSCEARMGRETRKDLSPTKLAMVTLVPVRNVTCLGLTLDSATY